MIMGGLAMRAKWTFKHTGTQKASENDEWERGEEKANLFENRFRSGGE